jgi:outer membrane murein-binding lipoprotein Lpp
MHVLMPEDFLDLPRLTAELAESTRQFEASMAKTFARVDDRMERGYTEAAVERQRIEDKVDRGFTEAAADRQRIEDKVDHVDVKVDRLEEKVDHVDAKVDRLEEKVDHVDAKVDRLEEKVDRGFAEAAAERGEMRNDIKQLQTDVGELKGFHVEAGYSRRVAGIFGRVIDAGHDASRDVAKHLRTAMDAQRVSEDDVDQALAADLIWAGRQHPSGLNIHLVIEASWTVDKTDVQRARQRAAILRAAGLRAIGVAAGKDWPDPIKALARQQNIVIVIDGKMDQASWQAALAGA